MGWGMRENDRPETKPQEGERGEVYEEGKKDVEVQPVGRNTAG